MALRRSALVAVAFSAFALLLPVAARADHGAPLLDDRLATYFGIAHSQWGGPLPSCVANGTTLIPVHAVLYDDPVASVAARADQPGCRLWLDRSSWREMRPLEACTIVVHEWGHLLGLAHSDDPLDLMAEFPTRAPAGCAKLERPRKARSSARRASACGSPAQRARSKRARTARAQRLGARTARAQHPRARTARAQRPRARSKRARTARGRSVRLACVRPA